MEVEEILSHPQVREIMKNGGTIMVIGDTNAGKTTLCQFLIRMASVERKGFLDLDLGQSTYLPGTLNAYYIWKEKTETAHYFVGSITPSGVISDVLKGAFQLKKWLFERNVDFITIDTTGYINHPEAISLKEAKIKVLSPDLVIVLAWEDLIPLIKETLLPLIRNFLIATPSSRVKARGPEERRKYREALFRLYFEKGVFRYLDLPFSLEMDNKNLSKGRLIGLLDEFHFMLSCGIVNSFEKGKLEIITPYLQDLKKIKFIKFGNLIVNPQTGEHRTLLNYSNCANSLLDITIL
jgi:polynucleotide 5'-kinase involved in rRNA processing